MLQLNCINLMENLKHEWYANHDNMLYLLTYDNNKSCFMLKKTFLSNKRKRLIRKHEKIEFSVLGKNFFAHDALNIECPMTNYVFHRISTTDDEKLYNFAICEIECQIDNFNIYKKLNNKVFSMIYCAIKLNFIEYNKKIYAIFKSNIDLSCDRLIGVTLRFRHALCFIFKNFHSGEFVALANDDNEQFITCGARVNANRKYTIFENPSSYDYINKQYANYEPNITDNFINQFIKNTLDNYFFIM